MNLKGLIEKKNEKISRMEELEKTIETEERAFSEEESTEFESLANDVESLSNTIAKIRELEGKKEKEEVPADEGSDNKTEEDEEKEQKENEERAFANYIRGIVEERGTDVTLTKADNGAVIPTSIADRIISKVYEICPIFEKSDRYNVKGNLDLPYYDESQSSIEVKYANEGETPDSTTGKFKSIQLTGYLASALTKVSKSLINNSQFDIVNYVVNKMAEAISRFIEKELLIGTEDKIDGLSKLTNVVTTEKAGKISVDDIIDLDDSIKDVFKKNAFYIMSKNTRTAIRKLKDGNGRYLLQDDINSAFGSVLLGKDVYVSDNMPEIAEGNTVIYFGDFSGLAVKMPTEIELEVLREKYADQHLIGVNAWLELDAKVEDAQKIAKLVIKESQTSNSQPEANPPEDSPEGE